MLNNCPYQVHPIDLSINKPFKHHIQKKSTAWYADKMNDQLEKFVYMEDCKVDLRLLIMKQLSKGYGYRVLSRK